MAKRWWALVPIALSMVVVGLDTTVLNVALPTLAVDLGAGTSDLQWVVDSYVLVLAALMLPIGALGDRYGRRRWLIGGLLVFGGASAVAAWAGSATTLVAARAVMGLGAAALTTLGLSIIPALFPPAARPCSWLSGWSSGRSRSRCSTCGCSGRGGSRWPPRR